MRVPPASAARSRGRRRARLDAAPRPARRDAQREWQRIAVVGDSVGPHEDFVGGGQVEFRVVPVERSARSSQPTPMLLVVAVDARTEPGHLRRPAHSGRDRRPRRAAPGRIAAGMRRTAGRDHDRTDDDRCCQERTDPHQWIVRRSPSPGTGARRCTARRPASRSRMAGPGCVARTRVRTRLAVARRAGSASGSRRARIGVATVPSTAMRPVNVPLPVAISTRYEQERRAATGTRAMAHAVRFRPRDRNVSESTSIDLAEQRQRAEHGRLAHREDDERGAEDAHRWPDHDSRVARWRCPQSRRGHWPARRR